MLLNSPRGFAILFLRHRTLTLIEAAPEKPDLAHFTIATLK